MTKLNANTKKAQAIIDDLARNRHMTSIYDAYDRPSRTKVDTFQAIRERAEATEGYNGDLHVTGRNSSAYATVYSYTTDGTTYVVKDTKDNTYVVAM